MIGNRVHAVQEADETGALRIRWIPEDKAFLVDVREAV
jgi:hypothetical protein